MPSPPVRELGEELGPMERHSNERTPHSGEPDLRVSFVRAFLLTVAKEADASLRQSSPTLASFRAKCALEHLEVWARGDALLGAMPSDEAKAERRWTLAGAAIAYRKVAAHAAEEQKQAIVPWFAALADAARGDLPPRQESADIDAYWLALGLAAASLSTGNETGWSRARAIMDDAKRTIGADGSLPIANSREANALHDHAFALMPLLTLAELARWKGESWHEPGDALGRLADLTVRGAADPEVFARRAGAAQDLAGGLGAGWLALYETARPEAGTHSAIELPSSHPWLGGNVLLLHDLISREAQ